MKWPSGRSLVAAVVFGCAFGALIGLVERAKQAPTGMGAGEEAEQVRLVIGAPDGGDGWITYYGAGEKPLAATQVPWKAYCKEVGSTQPVLAQLDDDPEPEVVVGLGAFDEMPGGGVCVLDDLEHGGRVLAWERAPGALDHDPGIETRVAAGDVDGDGRDEVVIGLGEAQSGEAVAYVLDDLDGHLALLQTLRVPWTAYAGGEAPSHPDDGESAGAPSACAGETRPAAGDLDGDGKAEVVLGLGARSGGWLAVFKAGTFTRWVRLPWAAYDAGGGGTWPACADVDGNRRAELLVGGEEDAKGCVAVLSDALAGARVSWLRVPWSGYAGGSARPLGCDLQGDSRHEVLLQLADGTRDVRVGALLGDTMDGHRFLGWRRGWRPRGTEVVEKPPAPPDPLREAREAALAGFQGRVPGGACVARNLSDGSVARLSGPLSRPRAGEPAALASEFLVENEAIWGLRADKDLLLARSTARDGKPSKAGFPVSFVQTVSGVPVLGCGLDVHVQTDGSIECVSGHVDPRASGLQFDPAPRVSADEAVRIAKGQVRGAVLDVSPPVLAAYIKDGRLLLTWQVGVLAIPGPDGREFLIDAHEGTIVREMSSLQGEERTTATGKTSLDHTVDLDVVRLAPEETGGASAVPLFVLRDESRSARGGPDIRVHDAHTIREGNNLLVGQAAGQVTLVSSPDNSFDEREHAGPVRAYHSIEKILRFWDDRFQRQGFDDGAPPADIEVFLNVLQQAEGKDTFEQATADPITKNILVGNAAYGALDLIAHEFTHLVAFSTGSIRQDLNSVAGEGGAVNEHVADAMAALIELREKSELAEFEASRMSADEIDQRAWIFGDETNDSSPGSLLRGTGIRAGTHNALFTHLSSVQSQSGVGAHTGHELLLDYWLYILARGTHAHSASSNRDNRDPEGRNPVSKIKVNGLTPNITGGTAFPGAQNLLPDSQTRELLEEVYADIVLRRTYDFTTGFAGFRDSVEESCKRHAPDHPEALAEVRKAFDAVGFPSVSIVGARFTREATTQEEITHLDALHPTPLVLLLNAGESGVVKLGVDNFTTDELPVDSVELVEEDREGDLDISDRNAQPSSLRRGAAGAEFAYRLSVARDAEPRTAKLRFRIQLRGLSVTEGVNPKQMEVQVRISGTSRDRSREALPIEIRSEITDLADDEIARTGIGPKQTFQVKVTVKNTSSRRIHGLVMQPQVAFLQIGGRVLTGFGALIGGESSAANAVAVEGTTDVSFGDIGPSGSQTRTCEFTLHEPKDVDLRPRAHRTGRVPLLFRDALARQIVSLVNVPLTREFRESAVKEVEETRGANFNLALKKEATGDLVDLRDAVARMRDIQKDLRDLDLADLPLFKEVEKELKRLEENGALERIAFRDLRIAEGQEEQGLLTFAKQLYQRVVSDFPTTAAAREAARRDSALPEDRFLLRLLMFRNAQQFLITGRSEDAIRVLTVLVVDQAIGPLLDTVKTLLESLKPLNERLAQKQLERVRSLISQGRLQEAAELKSDLAFFHRDTDVVKNATAEFISMNASLPPGGRRDLTTKLVEAEKDAGFTADLTRRLPLISAGQQVALSRFLSAEARARFAAKIDAGQALSQAEQSEVDRAIGSDLRQAQGLEDRGDRELAAVVLERVLQTFPQQPAAVAARERLDAIRAALAEADASTDPEVLRRRADGRIKEGAARETLASIDPAQAGASLLEVARGLESTDVIQAVATYSGIARTFPNSRAAQEATVRAQALQPQLREAQARVRLAAIRAIEDAGLASQAMEQYPFVPQTFPGTAAAAEAQQRLDALVAQALAPARALEATDLAAALRELRRLRAPFSLAQGAQTRLAELASAEERLAADGLQEARRLFDQGQGGPARQLLERILAEQATTHAVADFRANPDNLAPFQQSQEADRQRFAARFARVDELVAADRFVEAVAELQRVREESLGTSAAIDATNRALGILNDEFRRANRFQSDLDRFASENPQSEDVSRAAAALGDLRGQLVEEQKLVVVDRLRQRVAHARQLEAQGDIAGAGAEFDAAKIEMGPISIGLLGSVRTDVNDGLDRIRAASARLVEQRRAAEARAAEAALPQEERDRRAAEAQARADEAARRFDEEQVRVDAETAPLRDLAARAQGVQDDVLAAAARERRRAIDGSLVEQAARDLVEAQRFEAENDLLGAVARYQAIANSFEGTDPARVAEERLAALGVRSAGASREEQIQTQSILTERLLARVSELQTRGNLVDAAVAVRTVLRDFTGVRGETPAGQRALQASTALDALMLQALEQAVAAPRVEEAAALANALDFSRTISRADSDRARSLNGRIGHARTDRIRERIDQANALGSEAEKHQAFERLVHDFPNDTAAMAARFRHLLDDALAKEQAGDLVGALQIDFDVNQQTSFNQSPFGVARNASDARVRALRPAIQQQLRDAEGTQLAAIRQMESAGRADEAVAAIDALVSQFQRSFVGRDMPEFQDVQREAFALRTRVEGSSLRLRLEAALRQQEEAARAAEAARQAEAERRAEEERLAAETARAAEEAQRAAADEQARQQAAEAARLADEARQADETRRREEERLRAEEEARRAEEARLADEAARAAEQARAADEARRREADAQQAAEEAARREAEARRAAEEQARAAEEAARHAEEARRASDERARREAEEAAELARLHAEEEARAAEEARLRDEEARRQVEEERLRREEQARVAEEARRSEERARIAEEARRAEEAARLAGEEAARREQEAREAREEEARKDAEETARQARLHAEEEARAAEEARLREEQAQRQEAERLHHEEEARAAAEARRKEEEARAAEEARRAEETARQAAEEAARREEEARKAQEEQAKREAEEAARLARVRAEEEARAAEEARLREEETRRRAEEQRLRAEEEARAVLAARERAEAAHAAEEARRAEEAERKAGGEARRREEEARRAAEERRKIEEEKGAAGEALKKEAEARRLEARARRREESSRKAAEEARRLEEAAGLVAEARARAADEARAALDARRQEESARRAAEERLRLGAAAQGAEELALRLQAAAARGDGARSPNVAGAVDAALARREDAVRGAEAARQREDAARLAADHAAHDREAAARDVSAIERGASALDQAQRARRTADEAARARRDDASLRAAKEAAAREEAARQAAEEARARAVEARNAAVARIAAAASARAAEAAETRRTEAQRLAEEREKREGEARSVAEELRQRELEARRARDRSALQPSLDVARSRDGEAARGLVAALNAEIAGNRAAAEAQAAAIAIGSNEARQDAARDAGRARAAQAALDRAEARAKTAEAQAAQAADVARRLDALAHRVEEGAGSRALAAKLRSAADAAKRRAELAAQDLQAARRTAEDARKDPALPHGER